MQESSDDHPETAVRLEVSGLATGGRGVARSPEGEVWFLPASVPGDVVEAVPARRRPRFVEGQVVRHVRASPLRRSPPCEVQARCGGCPWMVLDESEQRRWKRRVLGDALARLGRIDDPEPDPVVACGEDLGYRNRVEFSLDFDPGGEAPALGFHHAAGGERLVDVSRCIVQHEDANRVLETIREMLFGSLRGALETVPAKEGLRIILRRSWSTGEILVILRRTGRGFPRARELAGLITKRHPEVCGVVQVIAQSGRRGGARTATLAGRGWIAERIAGRTYRLPAATFSQVNTVAASEVVALVARAAGNSQGRSLLDLYGGVGIHARALVAAGAGRAAVCDADAEAIRCGRDLARRDGEARVSFHHDDVLRFLRSEHLPPSPGLVVVNPPRTGLGRGVASGIARVAAPRLAMVSCDPATLARDLRALVDRGYRLERVTPVDMFPQTAHVEAVAVLSFG